MRCLALALGVLALAVAPTQLSAQSLSAAVLPTSRSVQTLIGAPATVFATIINAGPGTALACSIAPLTPLPMTFTYQTTDPATNALIGNKDMPVSIPAGLARTFLLVFTPTASFAPTEVLLSFACFNATAAPVIVGVNTVLLSASSQPTVDVIALAATLNGDGIVTVPGAGTTGVFAVATINVGAGGPVLLSADTNGVSLPVSVLLCETSPATGQCLTVLAPALVGTMNAGSTFTIGVFVTATSGLVFDPARHRVFFRVRDAQGQIRGSTSVAVRTLGS